MPPSTLTSPLARSCSRLLETPVLPRSQSALRTASEHRRPPPRTVLRFDRLPWPRISPSELVAPARPAARTRPRSSVPPPGSRAGATSLSEAFPPGRPTPPSDSFLFSPDLSIVTFSRLAKNKIKKNHRRCGQLLMRRISTLFRSRKNTATGDQKQPPPTKRAAAERDLTSPPPSSSVESRPARRSSRGSRWCVYLILSSTAPKTYVGVTTNFPRRLKQHNGELSGGAKASRGGRPWLCACVVGGFKDRSEACTFETKWKSITRRLSRKCEKEANDSSKQLLRHREKALVRVKDLLDCSHLEFEWAIDPS